MFGEENIVAWWGAILASIVLIWDIAKWMKGGARIRSIIKFNVSYDDGKLLSEEAIEGGVVRQYQNYCHIEFANIGKLPTTLMGLIASSKAESNAKDEFTVMDQAFTPHWEKKLPFVLKPGEIWSCRIEMNRYCRLLDCGKPIFSATFSHLKNPLKFSASKAANSKIKTERG